MGYDVGRAGHDWFPQIRAMGVQAGFGELVPPDAFQMRLRGYLSRSVRTFPSRPPKEPS